MGSGVGAEVPFEGDMCLDLLILCYTSDLSFQQIGVAGDQALERALGAAPPTPKRRQPSVIGSGAN